MSERVVNKNQNINGEKTAVFYLHQSNAQGLKILPNIMLPDNIPDYIYDELGEQRFKVLLDLIFSRESKLNTFYPGPSKGKDSGIDSRQLASNETKIVFQYKWRQITKYDRSKLLSAILSDFKKELAKHKDKKGIKFLFITNVAFTQQTINKFQETMADFPDIEIDYWDFEKLNLALRRNEDLVPRFFPIFSGKETDRIVAENKRLRTEVKKIIQTNEFSKAKNQLKNIFICNNLRKKYLFPFLYLLSPFYIDSRGSHNVDFLCQLFDITKEDFLGLVDLLTEENLIQKEGDIIVVKNELVAQQTLKELINNEDFDFKIIDDLLIK